MRRFLIASLLVVPVFALAQRPSTAIQHNRLRNQRLVERCPSAASFSTRPALAISNTSATSVDRQAVAIRFTSAQLNDVLKSLTVIDLGKGQITGISYNSVAPMEQRLGALRMPLDASATTGTCLARFAARASR